jgi:nitrogen fixation/metabolism regulation signal transduction histidine kinase
MKLSNKVPPAEQAILTKSVKTIVDQVDAMKRLVNEFRDYARLPSADLKPLDLNALITDVLQLYAPDGAQVPVTSSLAQACPPILGDAQQLRQVIHNLLQNAQDATLACMHALPHDGHTPEVSISTQYNPDSRRVRMTVRDSGMGFAPHILQRAFEPYVTTKVRGTGLGLAVVKKIADEHGARIDLSNRFTDPVTRENLAAEVLGDNTEKKVVGAQVILSFAVV